MLMARRRIYADIIWRGWRNRGVVISIGVYQAVSSSQVQIPALPHWAWIIIWLGVFLGITLEGAYRLIRKTHDNWIDNHRYEHGKLPPLPKGLEEMFIDYQSGEPISKNIRPITPSPQGWNYRLSPMLKKQWRETVTWLGYNPEDILWEMEKAAPPSGGIQPLVAKRKPFKQR